MEAGVGGGDDEHYGGRGGGGGKEGTKGREGGPALCCWREINRSKNSFYF